MHSLIAHRQVKLVVKRWDKYGGRLLADCFLEDGASLATLLLERGLCKAYGGAKKQAWTRAELEHILSQ